MTSEKKKNNKEDPIFKVDPDTGKLVPLPAKWLFPAVTNYDGDNPLLKNSARKTILVPLKFTDKDFKEALESPSSSVKKRKVDNSVRKELFNLPTKNSQTSRTSISHRQSLSRKSISTKKAKRMVKPKFNPSELSPLLDMEEVEEELINKKGCLQGYPFKTPTKPAIKFSKDTKKLRLEKKSSSVKDLSQKSRDSASSNEEFLELEKMCVVQPLKENICSQSPVSSVCILLEGTKLNGIKKTNNPLINDVTNIDSIVSAIETIIEKNNTTFERYKSIHEENMAKLSKILEAEKKEYENLVNFQDENKQKLSEFLFSLKCLCKDKSDRKF